MATVSTWQFIDFSGTPTEPVLPSNMLLAAAPTWINVDKPLAYVCS